MSLCIPAKILDQHLANIIYGEPCGDCWPAVLPSPNDNYLVHTAHCYQGSDQVSAVLMDVGPYRRRTARNCSAMTRRPLSRDRHIRRNPGCFGYSTYSSCAPMYGTPPSRSCHVGGSLLMFALFEGIRRRKCARRYYLAEQSCQSRSHIDRAKSDAWCDVPRPPE
jgi:hypothetical protein